METSVSVFILVLYFFTGFSIEPYESVIFMFFSNIVKFSRTFFIEVDM